MEHRRFHLFWPLVLIAAGVLWIMIQMGTLPVRNLWALVYIWPFFLIALGLGLIARSYWRYSSLLMDVLVVGGATLAVLFAPQFGWAQPPNYVYGGDMFLGPGEKGSGNVITQKRDVANFDTLQISYPAQVVVSQGQSESLSIHAEDNVIADIRTQVNGDQLVIEAVRRNSVHVIPTKPVEIRIVVKDLSKVDFRSAGQVRVEGLKTDDLQMTLDGAGSLTLENVELASLSCDLDGAGSIDASGTASRLEVRVNGLGSFNGGDLYTRIANAELNGAGSATVWVDDTLTARINGLGSVNYYGNPDIDRRVEGLGSIQSAGSK